MSLLFHALLFFMMLTLVIISIFDLILLLKLLELSSNSGTRARFKVLRISSDRHKI